MVDNYEQEIGNNIRAVRLGLGLSQECIAKKCEISGSTLSAYERSTKIPNLITIAKIAHALGVSIERLYYGDDSKAFINQASDEGRKIVNCFYYLWKQGVVYYYEDRHSDFVINNRNSSREDVKINLYIVKYQSPVRRLINGLNEYRDQIETYDDPDKYLEMLLSSVANEINQMIASEKVREKKKTTVRPAENGNR